MKKAWIDSSEQRIHLVGEYVGVAWNFDWVNTKQKDGRTVISRVKTGNPYIDAWDIYEIDEFNIADIDSDNNPLVGGMELDLARQIHKELGEAIEYLDSLQDKNIEVKP